MVTKIKNLKVEIKIRKRWLPLFKKYYFIITSNEFNLPDQTFKLEDWSSMKDMFAKLEDNNFCQIKIKIQNGKSFENLVDKNLL